MKIFSIEAVFKKLQADLQHKIDLKTKPLGALVEHPLKNAFNISVEVSPKMA